MPRYILEVLVAEGQPGVHLDPSYVLLELLIDLNPEAEEEIRRVMFRSKSQYNPAIGLRRELALALENQGKAGVVTMMMKPFLVKKPQVKGAHTFTLIPVIA